MATIRDIAKMSGYSVTTVSRVINQHPYVSEEKRQAILAIMAELNYVPNKTAQNLSNGRTYNIGVLIPFTNQPYYDQVLKGITNAAFEKGYRVTLLPTNYDKKLEKRYLDEFAAKEYEGLIVIVRANHLDTFENYLQYGPIVFCEEIANIDAASVYTDIEGALRESIAYLKQQGVKKLGLTLGRSKRLSCNSKTTISICEELWANFSKDDIFWDCYDGSRGEEALAFFNKKQVDGIVTNGDDIAAIISERHHCMTDVHVIGSGDSLISELLQLTTVDHHLIEHGETAFRLFLENSKETVKMPFQFITRSKALRQ